MNFHSYNLSVSLTGREGVGAGNSFCCKSLGVSSWKDSRAACQPPDSAPSFGLSLLPFSLKPGLMKEQSQDRLLPAAALNSSPLTGTDIRSPGHKQGVRQEVMPSSRAEAVPCQGVAHIHPNSSSQPQAAREPPPDHGHAEQITLQ